MNRNTKISMAVIKRMPKYLRSLQDLSRDNIESISSGELSKKIGFTASQIRHDLCCFGDFGQRGCGYNVQQLYKEVQCILGLDSKYKVVIVGAGNIGQALANYTMFDELGYKVNCIFDSNPKLFGIKIRDVEIQDAGALGSYLAENPIDIGIICVPRNQAEKIADILVENRIKGIWNFAPIDLSVPDNVKLENVHLSDSLFTLVFLFNEAAETILA